MTDHLPLVDVQAVPYKVQDAIASGKLDLATLDLVILAVGEPALSRALNLDLLGANGVKNRVE